MTSESVQITEGILDPIRPASLSPYMSQKDWAHLCAGVEMATRPARDHKTCVETFHCCGFLVPVVLFFLFISFMPPEYEGVFGGLVILLFPITVVMFMIFGCIECCVRETRRPIVEESLRQIMVDTTRLYKGTLSFHLMTDGSAAQEAMNDRSSGRYGRHFITTNYVLRISILDTERALGYVRHEDVDVATRLKQLEEIRGMISKQEYESKRQQILSSF